MSSIAEFDQELKSLSETKLPISASKIQSLTKAALKCAKHYKELVHSLEKYLQNCPTVYKLPAIYVIDSISRVCRKDRTDKYRESLVQRIESKLRGLFGMAALCTGKDRERLKRLLDVWQKNRIFSDDALAPLPGLLESLAPVADDHDSPSSAVHHQESSSTAKDASQSSTGASSKKDKKQRDAVEQQEPIVPPTLDVSDPHAQAMMASLFSMMAPSSTSQNGVEAKAQKAAATISTILSTSLGKSEDSLLDYDDLGASSSSELEDNTDDVMNSGGKSSSLKSMDKKQSSVTASGGGAGSTALITPEEQMRSLLTAAQSVLPSSKSTPAPPASSSSLSHPSQPMGVQPPNAAAVALAAFLNPHQQHGIPPPPMFMPPNPGAMMMNPMIAAGAGMVQPPFPPPIPPHLAHHLPGLQPPLPATSSAVGHHHLEQLKRDVLGDMMSHTGRMRKIDANLSPDCIRVLSRTLFLGTIPESVQEQELYTIFGNYEPVSITITPQSRTVFVKCRTRRAAEQAREELGTLQLQGQDIRINWACGFGSRELFERQPGWSTLPVSQLTDSERRSLAHEIGQEFISKHTQLITKGPPVHNERDYWFGGIFCEEPDTMVKKRPRDGGEEPLDDPRRRHRE